MARKLADSRPQAVELIARGVVLVSGSIADKPARLVSPAEPIELLGDPLSQRVARNELHHQIALGGVLFQSIYRRDVWILSDANISALRRKRAMPGIVGKSVRQDFHGGGKIIMDRMN